MISLADELKDVLQRPGKLLALERDFTLKAVAEVERLHSVIEKQKQEIIDLELACATLRRRVESLEADRT